MHIPTATAAGIALKLTGYILGVCLSASVSTALISDLAGYSHAVGEILVTIVTLIPLFTAAVKLGIDSFYDAKMALHYAAHAKTQSDMDHITTTQLVEALKLAHPEIAEQVTKPEGVPNESTTVADQEH